MDSKDLTMEDMEGIEIEGKNAFGILVVAAVRAKQIMDHEEEHMQRRPGTCQRGAEQARTEGPQFSQADPKHMQEEHHERHEEEHEQEIHGEANHEEEHEQEGHEHEQEQEQEEHEQEQEEEHGGEAEGPPELPQDFKDVIQNMANGRDVSEEILVIQKQLYASDIKIQQGRLSMPIKQLANDFLTKEEEIYLQGKNAVGNNHIMVQIIEPSLDQCNTKFYRWDMVKKKGKTSSFYLINGTWNRIVERNNLVVDMVLQVWSFRIDNALCFALVRVD